MATLTNQTVASTYPLLLKMATTGVDATVLRTVEDGDATSSALQMSAAAVKSTGTLTSLGDFDVNTDKFTVVAASGNTVVAGTLGVTGVLTATGGVTGDVTGDVTGAVTGNVTGDITGAVTATSGSLADGVTAATQTASDNSTKVATTAYVDALATVPTGCITQYGGSSAPSDWLLCDGAAVSRTTYSALFTAISTLYGVGDDSTTFNLPDLQGNVPVGKAASGTFNTLNNSGGAEDVTLTGAQSGTSAHTHGLNYGSPAAGTKYPETPYTSDTSGGDGGGTTISSTEVDASASHTNLQPYLVVNYIIKT